MTLLCLSISLNDFSCSIIEDVTLFEGGVSPFGEMEAHFLVLHRGVTEEA
jgi:hypothetical protein